MSIAEKLKILAVRYSGQEIQNEDGTYTQVADILLYAAGALEELQNRLEQALYMPFPKWIPVTDKLPQKCQFYLVTDFGVVEEAYYNSDCVWISRYDDKLKDVTHWMPLPKPPKDGE